MRRNALWIVLGLFVFLGCGCLALIGLVSGGFLALGAAVDAPVEVRMEPPVLEVAQGEEGRVEFLLYNPSDEEMVLEGVVLPASWLDGFVVKGSEPPFLRKEDDLGDERLVFDGLTIPAKGQRTLTLQVQGWEPGRYQGEGTLLFRDGSLTLFTLEGVVVPSSPTVPAKSMPIKVPAATPTPSPSPSPTATQTLADLVERLARSVVMVVALEGDTPVGSGSGTIVDPRGFILTNAHVVLDDAGGLVDYLLILVTETPDQPPVPKYWARVVQVDPRLDLAVIQIDRDLDGNPVADLNLPAVPLGDSDQLRLGETLLILGYPGIGGDTITFTQGEVSGFVPQPGYGPRAWIKTSATIAGGSSGGLAANARGELVGIPTQAGAGESGQVVDCRPLVDTNGDGVVDEQDTCVPIGGYINSLRPVNLAKPLLEAALSGQVAIATPQPTEATETPGEKEPELRLVVQVTFDDPRFQPWEPEASDKLRAWYQDGAFWLHLLKPEHLYWFTYGGHWLSDMAVGVWVEVTQPAGDGEIGLTCRVGEANDTFYAFSISEDGYYSIWYYDTDGGEALVPWTQLPQGRILVPGRQVHIAALCYGPWLVLFVDGEPIHEVEDHRLQAGYGGIVIGTWEKGGFAVRLDDFEIYTIEEE